MALHQCRSMCPRGFSLIEVMVAMGILGILSVGIASLLSSSFSMSKNADLKFGINNMRNQIISAVQHQLHWENTITVMRAAIPAPNIPASVSGILNQVELSPPDGWYELTVLMNGQGAYTTNYLGNNSVLIDVNLNNNTSAPAQRGFTLTGQKCTGFGIDADGAGPGTGNDACPIQWRVYWRPVCPVTFPCQAPGVNTRVDFAWRPGPALQIQRINPTLYNVSETPRNDPNMIVNLCTRFAGTWDGTACNFGNIVCPNHERLLGVQRVESPPGVFHMDPICQPILQGVVLTSCSGTTKLVGIDVNGNPLCAENLAGADTTACPAGEKVVRVDNHGNRVCARNLAGADLSVCPTGQKMVQLSDKGDRVCVATTNDTGNCLAGQSVVGVNSDGSPRCEAKLANTTVAGCAAGFHIDGITNGVPNCQPDTPDTVQQDCYDATIEIFIPPPAGCNGYTELWCDHVNGYRLVDASWQNSDACDENDLHTYGDKAYVNGGACCGLSLAGYYRQAQIHCCRTY